MKINKEFKTHWFEDENGNVVERDDPNADFYNSCHPCEINREVSEYCYHPRNKLIKFLCKNKRLYKIISRGKPKTFRHISTWATTYGSKWSQDCVVAMVNSGEYTLEQAIWVYTHACERCMNVLLYKYLNGANGYEEFSEKWAKAYTSCDFCKDIMVGVE